MFNAYKYIHLSSFCTSVEYSLEALFHLTFSMEKYYGEDSMSLLKEIPAFLYDDFTVQTNDM